MSTFITQRPNLYAAPSAFDGSAQDFNVHAAQPIARGVLRVYSLFFLVLGATGSIASVIGAFPSAFTFFFGLGLAAIGVGLRRERKLAAISLNVLGALALMGSFFTLATIHQLPSDLQPIGWLMIATNMLLYAPPIFATWALWHRLD